jgi:hypothetical protein
MVVAGNAGIPPVEAGLTSQSYCLSLSLIAQTTTMPQSTPLNAMLDSLLQNVKISRDLSMPLQAVAQSRRLRMELVEHGAVELLVEQLSAGNKNTRLFAMETLVHFTLDTKTHQRFHSNGAVEALLAHLQRPACEQDEAEEVLRVLHCLLTSPVIRERFVELDGISVMADLVLTGSLLQKDRAVFVLWMLAAVPSIHPKFLSTTAIPALVHALEEDSNDLIDVSLSALALLAENRQCRDLLVAMRVLEQLPRVIESDAREEVAYRADILMEMLVIPQRT